MSSPDGLRYSLNIHLSLSQGQLRDSTAFFACATWQSGAKPNYQYHKLQETTQAGSRRLRYSPLPNGDFVDNHVRDGVAFGVPSI